MVISCSALRGHFPLPRAPPWAVYIDSHYTAISHMPVVRGPRSRLPVKWTMGAHTLIGKLPDAQVGSK